MKISRIILTLSFVMLCTLATQFACATSYTFTEMSDPGQLIDEVRVNANGQLFFRTGVNVSLNNSGYFFEKNSHDTYAGACDVGYYNPLQACTYDSANGFRKIYFSIPPLPFFASFAYDVNENGDVLGGPGDPRTGSSNTDLQIVEIGGNLIKFDVSSYRRPSFNNRHEIVGAGVSGNAFYFYDGQRMALESLITNLGSFRIFAPTDINDAGYIAGYGMNNLGQVRSFVLTPDSLFSVPEPSTCAIFLTGLMIMIWLSRRHRF